MLALSAFHAIRDALAAVGDGSGAARARRAGDARGDPARHRRARRRRAAARGRAPVTAAARWRYAVRGARRRTRVPPRGRRWSGWPRPGARPRASPARRWSSPPTPRSAPSAAAGSSTRRSASRARRSRRSAGAVALALSAGGERRAVLRRRGHAGVRDLRRGRPRLGRRRRRDAGAGVAVAVVHGLAAAAGRRMVVTATTVEGSLGAAALDAAAIALARAQLAAADAGSAPAAVDRAADLPVVLHLPGTATFDVLLFGNGHVGRALAQVLRALPARVRWIDAREADFPAATAGNVEIVATDLPEAELRAAPTGATVVVATHSHALDFDIVAAALARDDWSYLGMIGSRGEARAARAAARRARPAAGRGRARRLPDRRRRGPAAGQAARHHRRRRRGGDPRPARARGAGRRCPGAVGWGIIAPMSDTPTLPPRLSPVGHHQDLPVGRRQRRRRPRRAARRDPRGAGRERRRQVDADEDHLRRRPPDAGTIRWNDAAVTIGNPARARRLGIGMVFQHFSLFETLTVAENIAAGPRPCRRRRPLRAHPRGLDALRPAARSRPARAHDVGGRAPARRDRPLPAAGPAAADHGRADVGADAAGRREAVRDAAPARRRGLQHPLHQPQARRDPRAVPPGDGAARRPRDRHLRSARTNPRPRWRG